MFTVQVNGRVTPDGHLEVEIPANMPAGEVRITIEAIAADFDSSEQFNQEEIADLLTFTPQSGVDIVAAGLVGGWEHKGIEDSVDFVDELRRKQERSKW